MASIYTAPSMSFIDTYINGAKELDRKRDESNKRMLEGMGNIVKGGVDAYKWQQRKDILDKAAQLDDEEKQIMAELNKLKSERDSDAKSNMSAIMAKSNWAGVPFPYKENEDEFVPPTGIGIYKKEYL